jgi:hypothetical protein
MLVVEVELLLMVPLVQEVLVVEVLVVDHVQMETLEQLTLAVELAEHQDSVL